MNTKYMNPYLAGFFLGIVLLASIFITGRGLGASGAIKSVVVETVDGLAPSHAESSPFYSTYVGPGKENPLKSWLVFEIAGVVIGAFISGLVSDRLKVVTEAGPRVKSGLRWTFAVVGGGAVRRRRTVRARMHKRRRTQRHGGPVDRRVRHDVGYFRHRLCRCLRCPETVVIKDIGSVHHGTVRT